jgi:hypothetical protein
MDFHLNPKTSAIFNFRQEAGQPLLTAGTIFLFGVSLIIAVLEQRHSIIERLATLQRVIKFLLSSVFLSPSSSFPFR